MGLRNLLWEYPAWVSKTASRLSAFFVAVAGVVAAILLFSLLTGVVIWKQQRVIFTGVLNYGIIGQFDSVKPLDVSADEANQAVTKLLFNSLVSADKSGHLYPELAETWAVSPDGKVYSFFLKKGTRWHDEVELTAKDVVSTFELLQTGDTQSGLSSLAKDVEVTARSTYEVVFKLKQVNSAFLELATIPILPAHVYGSTSYSRIIELGESIVPVGTGPYIFQKYEDGTIHFKANQRYFKGAPKIQVLTIRILPNFEIAEKELLEGKLHVISPLTGAQSLKFKEMESKSTRIITKPIIYANNTRLLLFSLKKEASYMGKDIQIRRAVARAVDRTAIVARVMGGTPAYGPYSSTSFAYSQKVESLLSYSINEANSLLEGIGWKYPYSGAAYRVKGEQELRITLTYLKSDANQAIAESLREQLLKVGINLLIHEVTQEEFVQRVLPEKEFELLLFEIQSGIDPDHYALWHSSQSEFPGLNLSSYNSPSIDNYLEIGRLQPNVDKRVIVYHAFQEELVQDATAIFLYNPAYREAYFDIINRNIPITVLSAGEIFSTVHQWTIEPGWRNWQTR